MTSTPTMNVAWQLWGAGLFGAVVGWYVYYINRHRKDTVQLGDIVTLIGAIGGGAVLSLFDKGSELMGAYGIGLAFGFFGYFVTLVGFVIASKRFRLDWFLDARRKDPELGWGYAGGGSGQPQIPMLVRGRSLTSAAVRMPLALAAPATGTNLAAAAATAPIVDTQIEIREIAKARGVRVDVVIGNAQPGGWIAAIDGAVVSSSSAASPVVLPGPVVGKVLEISATMKAVLPQSGRLSLLVTLRDDAGVQLGAPILIEYSAELGRGAAYSILVVFVEAA